MLVHRAILQARLEMCTVALSAGRLRSQKDMNICICCKPLHAICNGEPWCIVIAVMAYWILLVDLQEIGEGLLQAISDQQSS